MQGRFGGLGDRGRSRLGLLEIFLTFFAGNGSPLFCPRRAPWSVHHLLNQRPSIGMFEGLGNHGRSHLILLEVVSDILLQIGLPSSAIITPSYRPLVIA
jgi:hypothetical protein